MTTFDDRQKGFEKKFAHDADLKFKAESRRNKMLAEWAGGENGAARARRLRTTSRPCARLTLPKLAMTMCFVK